MSKASKAAPLCFSLCSSLVVCRCLSFFPYLFSTLPSFVILFSARLFTIARAPLLSLDRRRGLKHEDPLTTTPPINELTSSKKKLQLAPPRPSVATAVAGLLRRLHLSLFLPLPSPRLPSASDRGHRPGQRLRPGGGRRRRRPLRRPPPQGRRCLGLDAAALGRAQARDRKNDGSRRPRGRDVERGRGEGL